VSNATTESRPRRIAVIGAGSPNADSEAQALAVGREIARRGAVLVCGGLGGVMAAAARGAREAGGLSIGVLPGSDAHHANPWIDIPIATGMGDGRNLIVASAGDAVVAIGGQLGTLSEICFALLRGRPVVTLGSWDLDGVQDARRLESAGAVLEAAETPEQAVTRALELAEGS
jgi:uncharacterized protein (TIGR00725 family)